MKKLIIFLLLITVPIFAFDVASVFHDNVQIFQDSDNPSNAINGFQDIVSAYDLGEIKGPDAFNYYLQSMEYLIVLYSNKGDTKTVHTLFEKIIRSDPGHQLDKLFISPRIVQDFKSQRNQMVGYLKIECPVPNPDVSAGTLKLTPNSNGLYATLAGDLTLRIGKENYEPVNRNVTVSVGKTVDVKVELIRTLASVTVLTDPTGAQVFMDGVLMGETSGSVPVDYVKDHGETIRELGLNPSTLSNYFVINRVESGDHVLELKKDCYKPVRLTLPKLEKRDYQFKPVQLERSIGYLIVEAGADDQAGDLFVDSRRVGSLPVRDLEVCSGEHLLKVAFENGTFIKKLKVEEGEHRVVKAVPKPTLLFAGIKSLDSNLSIVQQVKKSLEQQFQKIPFYNSQTDDSYISAIDGLLERDRKVIGNIRKDYGQALIVFGVEKRVKLKRYIDISVLNTELYHEEKFTLDPANPTSEERFVHAISNMPRLVEDTAGVAVIRDPDRSLPVVISSSVETVQEGDIVVSVNGKECADEASFHKALVVPETKLLLERAGASLEVVVKVEVTPVVMRQNLNSLSYNSAYLYFLSKIQFPGTDVQKAGAQLNLAMCNLRFRQFEQAFDTLSMIQLPDRPGISAGTVLYLKGVCYKEIGSWIDLQTLYKNYHFNEGATVINSRGLRVRSLIDFTFEYLRKQ
ncbi:MAG: hypothetical protein CO090_03825 [Acidobacteria bacterium CG_4_9_14_3_um_filter_49_7]|nr:MAG: hypothetical protein CO090_03825 [Acidobacteria bacterium CG_4_9_14_3_um_filter_49_7]